MRPCFFLHSLSSMTAKLTGSSSFRVRQLRAQLKAWEMPTERGDISSTGRQEITTRPGTQPTTTINEQFPTPANSSNQCGKRLPGLADQNQCPSVLWSTRDEKYISKSRSMQQKAMVPVRSLSTVSFGATLSPSNHTRRVFPVDLKGTGDFFPEITYPHYDSSKSSKGDGRIPSDQYNMERQYFKGLLIYIRDFMCDLDELIQELEESTNKKGKTACRSPEKSNPPSLENSKLVSPSGGRDNRAFRSTGTKRLLDTLSLTASDLAEPEHHPKRVALQQKRCASPTMLSTAASSLASMVSIQRRTVRCWSSHISRDNDAEDLLPSFVMRRRNSTSTTSFAHVTGMPACSPLSSSGFGDGVGE